LVVCISALMFKTTKLRIMIRVNLIIRFIFKLTKLKNKCTSVIITTTP